MSITKIARLAAKVLPALLLCASSSVFAVTTSGTLAVSATVASACSVTGSTLAFGAYTSAQIDNSASLTVICTNSTPYNVGLDVGSGSGATLAVRKMTGSVSGTLNYSLYKDSGRSTVWGNTVGTDTATGTGNGLSQSMTVYGRVPAGQNPGVGVYSDSVTVTLTY
ncbi:Csu type fimbrial protein [Undibacterium sp. TJN19]|uniref:Csu type fimbrial protein n=1 Tax=Undibacterium sp. TJN19 TaxID=3413055 RepID=UPI003BF4359C